MKKTDRLAVNGFFMWLDCLYPQQRLPGGEPFQRATVYSEFRSRGLHLELAHGTQ